MTGTSGLPRTRLRRSTRKKKEKPIVIEDLSGDDEPQPQKKQKISQLRDRFRSKTPIATPITISEISRQPSRVEPQEKECKETDSVRERLISADARQWSDKYTPSSTEAVAVHAKKLKEVKEILADMLKPQTKSPYKILLLTGPAGSSKSTLIKCLAQELANPRSAEKPYVEWINPIDSRMSQFSDFLESVKMRVGASKAVILVEDIPNVFHEETRVKFQQSLLEYSYTDYEVPPLVICLTECDMPNEDSGNGGFCIDNNYIAETVLGRKLLNVPGLKRVKFNPVNFTLSKKCLYSIVSGEPTVFQPIASGETKSKVEEFAKFGDIRASICALQFWARWRLQGSTASSTPDMGKESVISIFHAVGKCIYGSKNEGESENDTINQVIKDYTTRADKLKLALLENYSSFAKGNYPLEKATEICDILSLADAVTPSSVSLELSTRGVSSKLRELGSGQSNHTGLTFPREWKINKISTNVTRDVEKYVELEFKKDGALRTLMDSNLFYGFYEPLINNQRSFKNKSKMAYLKSVNKPIADELHEPRWPYIQERLGGSFHEIYGDDTVAADDEIYTTASSNSAYFSHTMLTTTDNEDSESELDDDPIDDDSEDEDDFGDDDTFDKELLAVSQIPPTKIPKSEPLKREYSNLDLLNDINDFDFDDSDL